MNATKLEPSILHTQSHLLRCLSPLIIGFSATGLVLAQPNFTRITTGEIVTDRYHWHGQTWGDYDNDGDLDLFLVTTDSNWNPIYRNNGDGTFTRILEPSLQGLHHNANWWFAWVDYDNDGHLDLFLPDWSAYYGSSYKNLLFHNNGNGTFTRVTDNPIALDGGVSTAGGWGDYDRDGDLDLLVANGAGAMRAATNWFYLNQGGGSFLKLSTDLIRPLISESAQHAVPAWVDVDDDGWLDLFVSAFGSNSLFRNTGDGGFSKVTGDPLVSEQNSWMGMAWGDYDNDGDLDVLLTGTGYPTSTRPLALHRNEGGGHFHKMTQGDIGPLATEVANSSACAWGDYDNDGWLDLIIANGWLQSEGRLPLIYHNQGDGTFSKVTTGSPASDPGAIFAVNWVDYDQDGALDLFITDHDEGSTWANHLFHNDGNGNAWLEVKCVGTNSPRWGTGAKVRVQATLGGTERWQLRLIDAGGAPTGGQSFVAHFGLGDATNVSTLRIEWTSGIVQELRNLPVNQILTVTEPILPSSILPARLDVSLGADATFTLNPISSPPRTCQWRLNGADLAGETNVTLHLANVQTNQTGSYTAFVSDGTNGVTTRPAVLRVFDRPLITAQPTNQLARPGTNVTFTVSAYSPSPITYQWQANGTNLAGAPQATLTLTNVQLADDGVYTVIVTDTAGSATSAPAHLWILVNPLILQPPLSQTVVEGGDVTLSAVISGNPPPFLFQWRRGSTILTNIVQNERTGFFTLTSVQTNQGGLHRVCITNAASPNVTTVNATFTITVLPDVDADGLPDTWETEGGINQASAHHGTADDDGDGLCNGAEYLSGSDPTNALSYLKVDGILLEAGGEAVRLEFFAVSNKTYTVQYRDALDTGDWQRLADVVAVSTNRAVELSDPAAGAAHRRYYRLATPRIP